MRGGSRLKPAYVVATGLIVLAVAFLRPLLFGSGAPAFHHDWQWPLTAEAARSYLRATMQPLLPMNWWEPAWLPRFTPTLLIVWGGSFLFTSSEIYLKVLLVAVVAVAGFGMYLLARTVKAGYVSAAIAAGVYAANPFVADQVVAGHLWILMAYATLPIAAWSTYGRRAWPIQMLAYASLAVDTHYLVFAGIILAAYTVERRCLDRGILGAAIGCLAFVPPLLGAFLAHQSGALNGQAVYPFYVTVNSTQAADALLGVGYFPGYDAIGRSSLSTICLAVFPACVLVALLTRRWITPLFLFLCGALVCAGVNGPLAPILWAALVGSGPFSALRELFDFAQLTWLAFALGVAVSLTTRLRVAIFLPLAVCALLPDLSSAFSAQIPLYQARPEQMAVLSEAARLPGSGMIAPLPVDVPMSPVGFTTSGLDPLGLAIGNHGVLSSNHDLNAAARSFYAHPSAEAARVFRIGAILRRANYREFSIANLEPGYQIAAPRQPAEMASNAWKIEAFAEPSVIGLGPAVVCSHDDFSAVDVNLAHVFALDEAFCGRRKLSVDRAAFPYPRVGWVPYADLWRLMPDAANANNGALVTSGSRPYPRVEGCDDSTRYIYYGYESQGSHRTRFAFPVRGCAVPMTRPGSITVLSGATNDKVLEKRLAPRVAKIEAVHTIAPYLTTGTMSLDGDALLSSSTTFAPGWVLFTRAGIDHHEMADGIFNAWTVMGRGRFDFTIVYWPALVIFGFDAVLTVLWLSGIAWWWHESIAR